MITCTCSAESGSVKCVHQQKKQDVEKPKILWVISPIVLKVTHWILPKTPRQYIWDHMIHRIVTYM